MKREEHIQQEYYTRTAPLYDSMHSQEIEHETALKYVSTFIRMLGITSILDVGSGTGRAVKFFLKNEPSIKIMGIEPIENLIDWAVQKNKIPRELLICAKGEELPFNNKSFDAVCVFGVMHHVKNPNLVLKEMMRVAKKAIFISDSNRFGQGPMAMRWIKFLIYKVGWGPLVNLIKTKGRRYTFSDGDGIAYSYSIFDSYNELVKWADSVTLIPTAKKTGQKSWFGRLFNSSHILVCATKNS